MTCERSQAPCGPFMSDDLPTYSAAEAHANTHWRPFLSDTASDILRFVLAVTARFGKAARHLGYRTLLRGFAPNPRTGFGGIAPIIPVSAPALRRAVNELCDLCILVIDHNGRWRLNYAIVATDLAYREDVQRRVTTRHKRGGPLSTVEGIISWATFLVETMLSPFASQEQSRSTSSTACRPTECQTSEASVSDCNPSPLNSGSTSGAKREAVDGTDCAAKPTSAPIAVSSSSITSRLAQVMRKSHFFSRKPSQTPEKAGETYTFLIGTRGSCFPSYEWKQKPWEAFLRNANDLKSSILAAVDGRRSALADKRKARGNLADMGKLFNDAWIKGQRAANPDIPACGITASRDKSALKQQLLVPFREAGTDVAAFAKWVTENWTAIGVEYFPKSKYPATPAIRWVLACLPTYTQAFTVSGGEAVVTEAETKAQAAVQSIASAAERRIAKLQSSLDQANAKLKAKPRKAPRFVGGVDANKLKNFDFED
ncbi:helix-turn-helix DNA binding domain protein [Rhodobacter phage RcKickapoo]|nr:helix-turn-helix DNA binding domain protein [Rhodobacter phage RcKickapoo]UUV44438.1 helix-turn-helix DNA binding domain protein [Rhodobacter phage RcMenchie]